MRERERRPRADCRCAVLGAGGGKNARSSRAPGDPRIANELLVRVNGGEKIVDEKVTPGRTLQKAATQPDATSRGTTCAQPVEICEGAPSWAKHRRPPLACIATQITSCGP